MINTFDRICLCVLVCLELGNNKTVFINHKNVFGLLMANDVFDNQCMPFMHLYEKHLKGLFS